MRPNPPRDVDLIISEIGWGEDAIKIDLQYPRNRTVKAIEVDLSDVRAADGIRIEYDFERDGWVIKQASRFEWDEHEPIDHDWAEVAFVRAWGRVDVLQRK